MAIEWQRLLWLEVSLWQGATCLRYEAWMFVIKHFLEPAERTTLTWAADLSG